MDIVGNGERVQINVKWRKKTRITYTRTKARRNIRKVRKINRKISSVTSKEKFAQFLLSFSLSFFFLSEQKMFYIFRHLTKVLMFQRNGSKYSIYYTKEQKHTSSICRKLKITGHHKSAVRCTKLLYYKLKNKQNKIWKQCQKQTRTDRQTQLLLAKKISDKKLFNLTAKANARWLGYKYKHQKQNKWPLQLQLTHWPKLLKKEAVFLSFCCVT